MLDTLPAHPTDHESGEDLTGLDRSIPISGVGGMSSSTVGRS